VNHLVSEVTRRHMTVDQYLAFEQQSPARHEYLAGEVFAMTGSSLQHNTIATRLFAATSSHLQGTPWQAFMSDVKVRVRTNMRNYFYYPDLLVLSDSDQRADGEGHAPFVRTARLIAEVISPATENIDRREKAMMYREIASLEEYVLVAPEEYEVTIFRRRQHWRPVVCNTLEDLAEFRSIGLSLPLAHIYRDPPTASNQFTETRQRRNE
jgi:Uma2 family endonuclease